MTCSAPARHESSRSHPALSIQTISAHWPPLVGPGLGNGAQIHVLMRQVKGVRSVQGSGVLLSLELEEHTRITFRGASLQPNNSASLGAVPSSSPFSVSARNLDFVLSPSSSSGASASIFATTLWKRSSNRSTPVTAPSSLTVPTCTHTGPSSRSAAAPESG